MPTNQAITASLTDTTFAVVDTVAAVASITDDWLMMSAPATRPLAESHARPLAASDPEWVARMAGNARSIAALRPGWDGPGSIAISNRALYLATAHTRLALDGIGDAAAPRLVPGGDGSVQVEWHAKHGELEFDIDAHGRMSTWVRDHRNGAEFDADGEAALALFYRWAPWVASRQRYVPDEASQAQMPVFAIAA